MFLWFVKPKGRKPMDYSVTTFTIHTPIAVAMYLSYAMWFLIIPFLIMDFSGMIGIFRNLTILCVVTEFLSKLFHPTFKYF